MNQLEKYLSLVIKNVGLIISLVIFAYIFLLHLFRLIGPFESYIDPKAFDLTYLRLLFLSGVTLSTIGIVVSRVLKQIKIFSLIAYRKREIFIIVLTSFLLTVFYIPVFSIIGILRYPVFLILWLMFAYYLSQVTELYINFDYKEIAYLVRNFPSNNLINFSKLIFRKGTPHFIFLFFLSISLLVIIFSIFYTSKVVNDYTTRKTYVEKQNMSRFHMTEIKPKKAMHTQFVTITGYNLGWYMQSDSRYRIMTDDGQIKLIEEWTDRNLKFTVPLSLRPGLRKIWVERPSDDPKVKKALKSNVEEIEVFSRFVIYPDVDDSKLERAIKKLKRFAFYNFGLLGSLVITSYE